MHKTLKRILKPIYYSSALNPFRSAYCSAVFFNRYYRKRVFGIVGTTFRLPRELANFTYDLTPHNLNDLAHVVAIVSRKPVDEVRSYIDEARHDADLNHAIRQAMAKRAEIYDARLISPFGRRLGWYAFARALKPRLIVETGVERGHGALILCAALIRNAAEGSQGHYLGTDIDANAGWLLTGNYARVGKVLYGDSLESLKQVSGPIDLFINDSDHSAEYEYREYQTIRAKLSPRAIILGDNAHTNDRLATFSEENGRHFLFFKEEPERHWYPGAGIGISFAPNEQVPIKT